MAADARTVGDVKKKPAYIRPAIPLIWEKKDFTGGNISAAKSSVDLPLSTGEDNEELQEETHRQEPTTTHTPTQWEVTQVTRDLSHIYFRNSRVPAKSESEPVSENRTGVYAASPDAPNSAVRSVRRRARKKKESSGDSSKTKACSGRGVSGGTVPSHSERIGKLDTKNILGSELTSSLQALLKLRRDMEALEFLQIMLKISAIASLGTSYPTETQPNHCPKEQVPGKALRLRSHHIWNPERVKM